MFNKLIDLAVEKWRSTFFIIFLLFVFGINSYKNILKESSPEIVIPYILVSVNYKGVSPSDAEKMLVKPIENQVKSIPKVKKVKCQANFGSASCNIEFEAGNLSIEKALTDVRDAVNIAKKDFPPEADEPFVREFDINEEQPVLTINISSELPDDILFKITDDLEDLITSLNEVLSVTVYGTKEHSVDILIKPEVINQYNLSLNDFANIARQNKLVIGGTIKSSDAEYKVKIPGLIENLDELIYLPTQSSKENVITLKQIADIQKTYKDETSFGRLNGNKTITLNVAKRSGFNVIETVQKTRNIVDNYVKFLPESVKITYTNDASQNITDDLINLNNNLILAVIIVFFIVLNLIGLRESLIIMTTIPLSFLMGIMFLYLGGFTLNIVVLFALILGTGMIVDASIVIVEYAELFIKDGVSHKEAFKKAAKRMFIPVFSAVVTVLIVSAPLLFWPGIPGQFMKYLPLTLIALLSSSFIVAMFFLPCIGAKFGKSSNEISELSFSKLTKKPVEEVLSIKGPIGLYAKTVWLFLQNPKKTLLGLVLFLITIIFLYSKFNKGVSFFPDVETDFATIKVETTGNLNLSEKDKIMKQVEDLLSTIPDVKYYQTITFSSNSKTIGRIMLEFTDWRERRKPNIIMDEIRGKISEIPGIKANIKQRKMGPGSSKAIVLNILGKDQAELNKALDLLKNYMQSTGDFVDIEENLPPKKIQYSINIDRSKAAQYGIDIEAVGAFVSLATDGLIISNYRPTYSNDKVDIVLRFPPEYRSINDIKNIKIPSNNGNFVPISSFATVDAELEVTKIERIDQKRFIELSANIKTGEVQSAKIAELFKWIVANKNKTDAIIQFAGDAEDMQETQTFLMSAFLTALITMFLLFIMQFNSIGKTIIVMSAIFLSIFGVLIALMLTGQSFSIIMSGIAVMALAGIVVDTNILFIEEFKDLEAKNIEIKEALLKTAILRLKPILLASGTTVAGMMPMIFSASINFIERDFTIGAPSSQFWTQLSAGIAGGLTFVTILTLFITPAIILLEEKLKNKIKNVFKFKKSI